jgi:hypothetical protein
MGVFSWCIDLIYGILKPLKWSFLTISLYKNGISKKISTRKTLMKMFHNDKFKYIFYTYKWYFWKWIFHLHDITCGIIHLLMIFSKIKFSISIKSYVVFSTYIWNQISYCQNEYVMTIFKLKRFIGLKYYENFQTDFHHNRSIKKVPDMIIFDTANYISY